MRDFFAMAAAFAIAVGWTLVLYPLVRYFKRSWIFLFALALLLSFAMIVVRDIFAPNLSYGDIYLYCAGALLGLVCSWFLFFIRRSRFLDITPLSLSTIDENIFIGRVHLRHILYIAVKVEADGWKFYTDLAKTSPDPGLKSLLSDLAQDELKHKEIFTGLLERWLSLPPDKEILKVLAQALKQRGLFVSPPQADQTDIRAMLDYAVKQEVVTIEFYKWLGQLFPDARKRAKLDLLVEEESSHRDKLLKQIISA